MEPSRIASRRLNLSPAQQALFEKRLRGEIPSRQSSAKIPRRSDFHKAPLSLGQESMWLLEQLMPGNATFNLFKTLRIPGKVDRAMLERSLSEMVRRHEILRTGFHSEGGVPVQIVRPPEVLGVETFDFGHLPPDQRDAHFANFAKTRIARRFDLAGGPLVRADLFRMADEDYVVLLNLHHIICDGWSLGVFVRETKSLYQAFGRGQPSPLSELPLQYGDYATWQRSTLGADAIERQINFWRKHFAEGAGVLDLPFDRPRPVERTFRGARRSIGFKAPLVMRLRILCQRAQVTMFMLLLAAFAALLHRYSGAAKIVIGSPVANRGFREIEPLIGLFANTVALCVNFERDPTFRRLLESVRAETVDAYNNQDVPFEHVLKSMGIRREKGHSPLFQVMLAMQPPRAASIFGASDIDPATFAPPGSKFDLNLVLTEVEDGQVGGNIQYDSDLFDPDSIDRMIGHFTRMLEAIVANPDCRISELPYIDSEECSELVPASGLPPSDRAPKCVHQLFGEQAARTSDAIAIIFQDQRLSYAELDARTNRLANYLRTLGVGPEVVVGLCVERSLEMMIALIAILKAGGAYLPLDPGHPVDRTAGIVRGANAAVLITQTNMIDRLRLQRSEIEVILLDRDWPKIGREPVTAPVSMTALDNIAYVLFTSGSTGEPKGVLGSHRALANRLSWDTGPSTIDAVYAQKTTLNFIDALWEIFMPLLRGQSVLCVPEITACDPQKLIRLLAEEGATRIVLVPSLLRAILETAKDLEMSLPKLRYWACSGEPLPALLASVFESQHPQAELLNVYGTSEFWDATWCVASSKRDGRGIPIGRPLPDMRVLVLDRGLQPLPVNAVGELFVGGAGVARGYLERPDWTAERFVPDPFGLGMRLYQTGDMAIRRADGSLAFVGRRDNQVKIRGHRVELAEVEAALLTYPDIEQVAAVIREDVPGEGRLTGYFVKAPGSAADPVELRAHLRSILPEHMVPSALVELDRMPLTSSGKIDRRLLPSHEGLSRSANYAAPRAPMEQTLAKIWRDILQLDRVGIDDGFFDIGGHSLLMVRVQNSLREQLLREIEMLTLFQYPTIRALAAYLTDQKPDAVVTQSRQRGEMRRMSRSRRRAAPGS